MLFSWRKQEVSCPLFFEALGSTLREIPVWFSFAAFQMDIVVYALLKDFPVKGAWGLTVILGLLTFRQKHLLQRLKRIPVYLLEVSPFCQEPHRHILSEISFSKRPYFFVSPFQLNGHTLNLISALSHLDHLCFWNSVIHSPFVSFFSQSMDQLEWVFQCLKASHCWTLLLFISANSF